MFIERGIQSELSLCVKHYAKANNFYTKGHYNVNEPTSNLMYIDCNKLYSWALYKPMPKNGFKWIKNVLYIIKMMDKNTFDLMSIEDDTSEGYILKKGIEYPAMYHKEHSEFPFLPDKCPPNEKYKTLLTIL